MCRILFDTGPIYNDGRPIAIVVGESGVYTANRGQDHTLLDITRFPGPRANAAANARLRIT